MGNKEERYKSFLEDYTYFDKVEIEEKKDEAIENIFIDLCNYWVEEWKDFDVQEIKNILENVNIFIKNIALKYLLEKGYEIEDILFLLGGHINKENLFDFNNEYLKDQTKNKKYKYLGK